jgi:hypothetical protein
MEDDDRTPIFKAHCPKCGATNLQFIETVDRYYHVAGVNDDGVYIIEPDWPPDIDDEGAEQRLSCRDCYYTWHTDGRDTDGVTTEIDWFDDTLAVLAY